jgi:CubicO group peptidase (beta-lactamase class C family)
MPSFSAARLARIAPFLEAQVAAGLPGVVALVARGDVVHVVTAGVQDLASQVPMKRETLFRLASMTKPLVAAAALTLIEEGRFALDDPVERWLPEIANPRVLRSIESDLTDTVPAIAPITVRDVMTFRLGWGAIMAPPDTYPIQRAMAASGIAPGARQLRVTPDEFMRRLGAMPLLHQPGERWMYHIGIDVLLVLLERVSGRSFPELLAERITGPLGMKDTGSYVFDSARDRLATAYLAQSDGSALAVWDSADGDWSAPPLFANSLVSSTDDYLVFCRMLLAGGVGPGGRILSRAAVTLMTSDQITAEQKARSPFFPGFWESNGWGMGVAVVTRRVDVSTNPGAFGWSGGTGTHFVADPAEGLVVVVLTQRLMRGPSDSAVGRDVVTLSYAALDD